MGQPHHAPDDSSQRKATDDEVIMPTHRYTVRIYYEDTDHSGVVYHANYLKYFERAREHAIGRERLVRLWQDQGLGFAVYRAELGYQEAAEFGDELEIRSTFRTEGDYRVIWQQEAWRQGSRKAAVKAEIQLVCLDRQRRLRPIPPLEGPDSG
jgi:acyl-CoA thioester hydrolase